MKKLLQHSTLRDLLILLGLTLALGIYMIANTAVIAKDGVLYIERAQHLPTQFAKILNTNEPFGFPALIFGTHRLLAVFSETDSNLRWILSGQILVFFCRFVAVGVLYFFGKGLFDRRRAFWGVLVLIFLPYPAEIGADVLRDWPHLLFLFAGLLCLYQGIRKEHWGYFFASGLLSGFGYLIRPECAQVVIYGIIFFILTIVIIPHRYASVRKNWFYAMLPAGFLAVFIPYACCVKNAVPTKLQKLYSNVLYLQMPPKEMIESGPCVTQAGVISGMKQVVPAGSHLLQRLTENLMYFFFGPAIVGIWCFFLKSQNRNSRWLIAMFIGFYVLVLCLLYIHWGYISKRHVLALTAMLCFFVPSGLEVISGWLCRSPDKNRRCSETWFIVLTAIGIAACIPKLARPIGHDKTHYREASVWIAENTPLRARFYTFDRRIPFYAHRSYRIYPDAQRFKANFNQPYLITSSKDGQLEIPLSPELLLQARFPLDKEDKAVLIYRKPRNTTGPSAPILQK
jgi:hypothetical protein